MGFNLFHLSFLEADYVFIRLCVFSCCELFRFISVGGLFVASTLSFVFNSKQSGTKLLWFLISSNFNLLLRILAFKFGVYCLWMLKSRKNLSMDV